MVSVLPSLCVVYSSWWALVPDCVAAHLLISSRGYQRLQHQGCPKLAQLARWWQENLNTRILQPAASSNLARPRLHGSTNHRPPQRDNQPSRTNAPHQPGAALMCFRQHLPNILGHCPRWENGGPRTSCAMFLFTRYTALPYGGQVVYGPKYCERRMIWKA